MTAKASDTIKQITKQRQALESLIRIAQSVHSQQAALSELALAARPSQDFPKSVLNFFAAVEQRMGDTPIPEVLKKIETIEAVTQQDLSKIIYLATLDVNQLRANQIQNPQIENIDIASFADAISQFKRRTQTALALRVLLSKRGVVIQPIKLSISQEKLNQEIQALKQKEIHCVEQIKDEINQIIDDTQMLLKLDSLSDEMKQHLSEVKQAMQVNLQHLDNGGAVTQIPNVYEIVTLESNPTREEMLAEAPVDEAPAPPAKPATTASATSSEQQATEENDTVANPFLNKKRKPRSYWWIFKLWIVSPWKTTWQSLVKKYR